MQKKTIPNYVDEFLTYLKLEGKEDSTIKRYAYDLDEFFYWLEANNYSSDKNSIFELDKDILLGFVKYLSDSKGLAWVTIKRNISALNQLLSFLQVHDSILLSSDNIISIRNESQLTKDDFVFEGEYKRLIKSIYSKEDLTDHEMQTRGLLVDRNAAILILFYKYGLSLQEVVNINMRDISFIQNTIQVPSQIGKRIINLSQKDKVSLHKYYSIIPEPVRPRDYTYHPFFVAVDFNRKTFRWDYDEDSPKRIHQRSIQKMLRKEIRRAGLKPNITAQSFRNGFILNRLVSGKNIDDIRLEIGLKTNITLRRYLEFYLNLKQTEGLTNTAK